MTPAKRQDDVEMQEISSNCSFQWENHQLHQKYTSYQSSPPVFWYNLVSKVPPEETKNLFYHFACFLYDDYQMKVTVSPPFLFTATPLTRGSKHMEASSLFELFRLAICFHIGTAAGPSRFSPHTVDGMTAPHAETCVTALLS